MNTTFPTSIDNLDIRTWETFRPFFDELASRDVDESNQREWLADWSHMSKVVQESIAKSYIDRSLDTSNEAIESVYMDVIAKVRPSALEANQALTERLLELDIEDADLELVLRNLRADADLFSAENLPIQTDVQKLVSEYDKITGGMTYDWDGEEMNVSKLSVKLNDSDRAVSERAFTVIMGLWQENRDAINAIYLKLLPMRAQLAANAGKKDYRDYVFVEKKRFDYSAAECAQFHDAIEEAVVPVVSRILEEKRQQLGVETLKPWDWVPEMARTVDSSTETPLAPYADAEDLTRRSLSIFNKLDPELGHYFATIADNDLLDLDTRNGKSMGAYCYSMPLRQIPFVFMNGAGTSKNIVTMLHECGHAFHGFEAMRNQELVWQQRAPMEFNEVASMAMELLASPYLTKEQGGFYTDAEAARHRLQHLEKIVMFFPYMAVVDAFQHWVYTNIDQINDTSVLDAKYLDLCQRFLPGLDWTGYEEVRMSGWHRKPHIFKSPFYYIEYGMAQVGALQVWRNSLQDHGKALADYRHALSMGGTRTLTQLFEAAGAEFRFDGEMLGELMQLVETTMDDLKQTLKSI